MKVIYLLTVVVFTAGLPLKAQTTATANSADSIEHIEMYGETGKGDTAIIFYMVIAGKFSLQMKRNAISF